MHSKVWKEQALSNYFCNFTIPSWNKMLDQLTKISSKSKNNVRIHSNECHGNSHGNIILLSLNNFLSTCWILLWFSLMFSCWTFVKVLWCVHFSVLFYLFSYFSGLPVLYRNFVYLSFTTVHVHLQANHISGTIRWSKQKEI